MKTISVKLTLAFLLVAVIAAALVALIVRQTSPERLNDLLRAQAQSQLEKLLGDYYSDNGSFDGIGRALEAGGFLPALPRPEQPGLPANPHPNRLAFALADRRGVVILSMLPNLTVGMRLPPERLAAGKALVVDGEIIGTLFLPAEAFTLSAAEQAYLDRTTQALLWAALGAVAAALATGLVLARSFTRPLRALTLAAQRMAQGELEQDVPVRSRDEIGQLTEAFNSMSASLARANALRRQMTADIAHDLRTPLTVIGGYVESMQEGVLAPTPERLATIRAEIERLQRLVEDLRTLSRADAGELGLLPSIVPPAALLERIAGVYRHTAEKKEIRLQVDAAADLEPIHVDEERMVQVLANLVDNALRYTPAGGSITLAAAQQERGTTLTVQDSGQGIPAEDLAHIFERFYRADQSRSDADGGASGLGLAIARALVEAHGGTLEADSTPGQGTIMTIRLPLMYNATRTIREAG